jgi:hypothetical protein
MPGALVVVLVTFLARASAAEPVEISGIPSVRIEKLYPPMIGPSTKRTVRFSRPGWVRGMRVRLSDASGASADGRGILCHAYLRNTETNIGRDLKGYGVRQTSFSLGSDEDDEDVELPPGFGLAVDTGAVYEFDATLQSGDLKNNGTYSVKADYDFIPADGPEPARTLEGFRVAFVSDRGRLEWTVPPGRHAYDFEFGLPDYDVHGITFHLHPYVTGVEVVEKGTGRVLYRGTVEPRANGYGKSPRFWSAEGLPLSRGKRYVFRVEYGNSSGKPQETMAIMWLYASKR